MRLTFTKGSGKTDALLVEREGLPAERIDCPKQGIVPHDMVHYAVESVVGHGFLGLVADGAPAAFTTIGGAEEEAVERLVECFQAELWGERVAAAELIAAYEHACESRGHSVLPVGKGQIEAIRVKLDELGRQWSAVPVYGVLALEL